MRLWEIIIVSVGLSLDAFTIAVCRGSTQGKLNKLTATLVGIIFGLIQTLMLAAGMIIAIYPMLNIQNEKIISINQWFSAIILIYLGIKIQYGISICNKYRYLYFRYWIWIIKNKSYNKYDSFIYCYKHISCIWVMGWILYGKQIQKTNRYMWRNHSFNYWHKDYI